MTRPALVKKHFISPVRAPPRKSKEASMTGPTLGRKHFVCPVRAPPRYSEQASRANTETKVVISPKKLSPARKGTGSSRKVFRLKVIFNDGGITIDAAANQTMTHVMGIVCSKWLNILRNGDGSIDAHPWKVRGPPLTEFVYIYRDKVEDRRTKKWREAHELCEKSRQTILAYEKLESIQGLDEGRPLTVVYGIDHSTKFDIQLVQKYISKPGYRYPKLVPSVADKLAQSFHLYNPPKLCNPQPFCVNLDDIFPFANKAMFQCGERWVCPFPSSPSNGGFICGEFQRRFDVLFLPYKSSCLNEALVVMDLAMMKYPEKAGEINSRLALPLALPFGKEAKFNVYMQEPGCESRICDLISNKKFNKFLSNNNKVVWRINDDQRRKYVNIIHSMFPICSSEYDNGRWASYRNRKVIIGEGNDKGGEERGVPRKVLAEVSCNVRSLHEFFCICEALFKRIEKEEAEEIERLGRDLASLRI